MPRVLLGLCIMMLSIPGFAHHSGGLWDKDKTMTLHGTVRQFQWTNPHCFIELLVPAESPNTGGPAGERVWSIEMASPFQVLTGGWKPGTLKSGDRIEVTVHPARDGSPSGDFISAMGSDGQPLGQKEHAP